MSRERAGTIAAVVVTAALLVWAAVLGVRFHTETPADGAVSPSSTQPTGQPTKKPTKQPTSSTTSSTPATPVTLDLPAHPTVLVLGDAWSAGSGVLPKQAYPALIRRALGWQVRTVVGGTGSGFVTSGASGTLDQRFLGLNPPRRVDLVVVQGGNADVEAGGIDAYQVSQAARTLISDIRKQYSRAPILLVGPGAPASASSAVTGSTTSTDVALAAVASADGAAYVSPTSADWFATSATQGLFRGLNLTVLGQQLVATRFERAVAALQR